MPNFSPTVATLAISGGSTSFIPPRFSPGAARLRITGGSPSWTVGDAASFVPTLNRLVEFDVLFNKDGTPTPRMMGMWQIFCESLEGSFAGLSAAVIEARLAAAEALAASAVSTAMATESRISIVNSYTSPTGVLSAANTGVVTIAAHDRYYGDGSSVSVNSGSVSGFSSGDYVTVYYDDAGRAGGAVTYAGTLNAVAQSGARHVVGAVTIPAAGAATTTGTSVPAPGYIPKFDDVEVREYER